MGTDRSQAYRGPCPCGLGQVDIQFCTPDHPWPTNSKWFEAKIICEKCAETYSLEEQGQYYGVVEKREILQRKKRYEAYQAAAKNLMASKQAQEIISRFTMLLDNQRSMAACHRLLSAHQLINESYGTFTRHWKGVKAWVSSNIRAEQLETLSAAVGLQDEYIHAAVTDLKRLWEEYMKPLAFHGDPLFETSSYTHEHCITR
jgi:hypothetical protein